MTNRTGLAHSGRCPTPPGDLYPHHGPQNHRNSIPRRDLSTARTRKNMAVHLIPEEPARMALTPFVVRYGGFPLDHRANRLSGHSLAKNGHSLTGADAAGWDVAGT